MNNGFKFNKKRKHYAYVYTVKNGWCFNILLTTKGESINKKHGKKIVIKNIRLYKHPNSSSKLDVVFIFNHAPYVDRIEVFDNKILNWKWDPNDKRKIKRFKKYSKNKKYFETI